MIDALIGDKAIVNALKAGGGDAITLKKRGFIQRRVSGDADAPLVNILAAFMDKVNVLTAPVTRAVHRTKKGDAPIAIEAMPDKEEKIVARRLAEHERNMRANLEGIRQLAETEQ